MIEFITQLLVIVLGVMDLRVLVRRLVCLRATAPSSEMAPHFQDYVSKLVDAVSNNDLEAVKFLIEREGIWPLSNEDERKIIDLAAEKRNLEILRYVLEKERSLLLKQDDEVRQSELKYIARIAAKTGCRSILEYVVQKEPSVLTSEDVAHLSERYTSSVPDVMGYVPERETTILTEEEEEESIGQIAAKNGHLDIIRYLRKREPSTLAKEDAYRKNIALVAAENGHWNIVWYVAARSPSLLATKDCDGDNILHLAIRKNTLDLKILKILVEEEGIPLLETNAERYTTAHTAAECGNLAVLRYMVEKVPSVLTTITKGSKTIAHIAAYARRWNILWYVLRKNPSLFTKKDSRDYTPLHLAVKENAVDVDAFKILIEKKGISLTETNCFGYTMAHSAAERGNLDIFRYIVEKEPSILTKKSDDGTVAAVAAKNGRWNIIRFLAKKNPLVYSEDIFHGETILHSAIANNVVDMRTLKFLVEEKGVPLTGTNWLGETIAHYAAKNKDNIDVLEYIGERAPSLLETCSAENTIAHIAAKEGRLQDMIDFLVKKTPLLFAKGDSRGDIVLHLAIERNLIDLKTLKFLVEENGFPLSKTDGKGNTIAHIAAEKGIPDIVRYVVERNPSILATKNKNGDTIAHIAVKNNHLNIILNVAEKNPSAFAIEDSHKNTVLHLAAEKNILSKGIFEFLVDKIGVPPTATNTDEETVAHIAARKGCEDIVRCTAEKASSIFAKKNSNGETIAFLAAENGRMSIIKFIAKENPAALLEKVPPDSTVIHLAIEKLAVDVETLKFLVEEKGIPLVETNSREKNIVCIAAKIGNLDMIKFVATKIPAALAAKDCNGDTVAQLAARYHRFDVLRYVVEKSPTLLAQNFYTLLFERSSGDEDLCSIIKYLEVKYNGMENNCNYQDFIRVVVHKAVQSGQWNVLKYFIREKQVDVNLKNDQGESLVFTALRYKRHDIFSYLVEEENADLTVLNQDENNILYIIVDEGDLPALRYVLDERKTPIDVNWRNKFGHTLLHVAVQRSVVVQKAVAILVYLIEQKHANVNAVDRQGKTPVYYAASHADHKIYDYLIHHGAKPRLKNGDGHQFGKDARWKNRSRRSVPPHLIRMSKQFLMLDEFPMYTITGDVTNHSYDAGKNFSNTMSQLSNFLIVGALFFKSRTNGSPQQRVRHNTILLSPLELLDDEMDSPASAFADGVGM